MLELRGNSSEAVGDLIAMRGDNVAAVCQSLRRG